MNEALTEAQALEAIEARLSPTPEPTEPPQEPEAVEPVEEIEDGDAPDADEEPGEAEDTDGVDAELEDDEGDEIEEDDGEEEDDDAPSLHDLLVEDDDGNVMVKTKVFGEEKLEPLDKIVARAQKDMAADTRLSEAKTQAQLAAETQKAATLKFEEASQVLAALEQEYQVIQDTVKLTPEQEADLRQSDPEKLLGLKDLERARETRLQELRTQQAHLKQEAVAEQQAKLLELLPDWNDPETLARERDSVITHARNAGFSDAEINGFVDARLMPVFLDAFRYQQGQQKAKTVRRKAKKAPTVVKNKSAPVPQQTAKQRRMAEARKRLDQTNSIDAAVEAYMAGRE